MYQSPYPPQTYYPTTGAPYGGYAPSQGYSPASAPTPNFPTSVRGRVVPDAASILPNEVPMDGSVSLFPKEDYSVIFAKQWNSDGTIKTIEFEPKGIEPRKDILDEVVERLDRIEKSLAGRRTTRKPKEAENADA